MGFEKNGEGVFVLAPLLQHSITPLDHRSMFLLISLSFSQS
jgi:hypothetical protein